MTGGEDDRAFGWDAATGEERWRCDAGFKDSVVQARFSHDGSYLAAADMSGVIKVWKVTTKEAVWEFETSDITVRSNPNVQSFLKHEIEMQCHFLVDGLAPRRQRALRDDRRLRAVDVEDSERR